MTKIPLICAVIFFTTSCKNKEYILLGPIKGKVSSSKDSISIEGAKIYTDKNAFNAFDPIYTNKDGLFFISKTAVDDYKDMHLQKEISYNLLVEKKGHKKTVIDVRNFVKHAMPGASDTIDLGTIYLDIDKPSDEKSTHSNAKTNWVGNYTCNFLRLEEESADPRAWGMIYLDIGEKYARFHLDTYNEDVKKTLIIVHINSDEIQLAASDNKDSVLSVKLVKDKYLLSGNLMENIIREKEMYELKKE